MNFYNTDKGVLWLQIQLQAGKAIATMWSTVGVKIIQIGCVVCQKVLGSSPSSGSAFRHTHKTGTYKNSEEQACLPSSQVGHLSWVFRTYKNI